MFLLVLTFTNATIINVPAEQPTIQAGIDTAVDADTVLVQPGTYVENIIFNGKNITVASLFYTTQDTSYISQNIIDGNQSGIVLNIYNVDSTAVISGFTITNGSEGGILCYDSSPNLENLTITGNSVADEVGGGGIRCEFNSNPSLENVVISGNNAFWSGGGIYLSQSSPNLKNVVISNNSATYGWGGGIYCYTNCSPSLENVTIAGNSALICNGIYSSFGYLVITNSILWNDSYPEIYDDYSASITATYSDIQGGYGGTGNIDSDPLFTGDYHLQPDSPCIDTGDPASPLDPDGTIADMGAYYYDQIISLDPPLNITVVIIGSSIHLSWDAVTNATSYKVYSSDDPYTGFLEDTSGSFAGESWSTSILNEKKFYYMKAVR